MATDSITADDPGLFRGHNALTVDVEDYFQVSAFAPHIPRSEWSAWQIRVDRNLVRILDLFDRHGVQATFFTLGWVAERFPELIRDVVSRGHELASHGYGHQRVGELGRVGFLEDIRRAKDVLEDIAGVPVVGYRAPSFSIDKETLWAYECLAEAGYRYSSSVYPIRHDHYGMPDTPRFPYAVAEAAPITELPVTTVRVLGRSMPAGGGGYFRLLPYALSKWSLERVNSRDGRPCIFYFHPWEIDPEQPRPEGLSARTRFRHYLNLHRMEDRLNRLLDDFQWARLDEVFKEEVHA